MRLSSQEGRAVAEITTLPGCSQAAVIHGAYVAPDCRGGGRGYAAHVERLSRLKSEFLYDCAICTADDSNAAQIAILNKAGWVKALVFKSSKTGHMVGLWAKAL